MRHASLGFSLCLLLVGGLLLSKPTAAQLKTPDLSKLWHQWRGPTRDGHYPGGPWPDSLQEPALKQMWRVELAQGYPGPVVAEDRVFVAETRDQKTEVVRALDRNTGAELWKAEWPGALKVPFFAAANGSWIRSTPAYDGQSLYVAGMRDLLVCLDAATGKERWKVDFVERYKTQVPAFGFVCSPLVIGDFVYVQAGGAFIKLDKKTGESLWRVLEDGGGMNGSAFSSPFPISVFGYDQILVQTRSTLAGVDPVAGAVMWRQPVPAFQGMNIFTPIFHSADRVFTSSYGGGSFNYQLSRNDKKEFTISQTWKNTNQGYMSSPLVYKDKLYIHLHSQRFGCFDLVTGEKKWVSEPFGKYWSLIGLSDRILALDERGDLLLIRVNPDKFDLIDRRSISKAPAWAHLALSGDQIFIRELNAIAAYRWSATVKAGR